MSNEALTTNNPARRPAWLKVKLPGGEGYTEVKRIARDKRLHTVCEDARCPNVGECWGARTATFMILGDICTRACGFCSVKSGRPTELDLAEPQRTAEAVAKLGIKHAVITSVDRDDLADGGAALFAETIRQIHNLSPQTAVEVLIPDFKGSEEALRTVLDARPEVLGHNVETHPRLYRRVRAGHKYERSLDVLRRAKQIKPEVKTKSNIMLGHGETEEEVLQVIADLVAIGIDGLTLSQYLQPTKEHLPVLRWVTPDEFAALKKKAHAMGVPFVQSGPLVRSSYRAEELFQTIDKPRQS